MLSCKVEYRNNDKKQIKQNMKTVTFRSEGLDLKGNLYYPSNYSETEKYPAIVVSGSWTTVKEQMAGLYAKRLAENGFISLAFDFRNFGESEGEPRFYESPELKKIDVKNAVTFLRSLEEVDSTKIGAFGVCAGAMYTLTAAAEDSRIKSVVTAASWLHDSEAIKLFYGGEEGVNTKITAAKEAKQKYAQTGEVAYIPTISQTDENAAMYGPFDYYLNTDRGAISQWSNDKFAVAGWEDWLSANPMTAAKNLNQPTLMIHSDGAVLPDYTKKFYNEVAAKDKELIWLETKLESPFHQFYFYDQEDEVSTSINNASAWFKAKM
ncbi:alpha/beta hydrolase [Cytophaga sp. FL35]|uniref:alpha/beta hydrolase n=1 Tax=Cytophaga sp. FL35 TaxID=1904456 RepID=UPI0025706478|nr:alpha/beta hydrolase [Cytophaga sp. FL35]